MAQNNYPGPTKIVSPEVARLHNIVLSVSKLLCIHARGSDCDHRPRKLLTNERPGSGGGDQSEGGESVTGLYDVDVLAPHLVQQLHVGLIVRKLL